MLNLRAFCNHVVNLSIILRHKYAVVKCFSMVAAWKENRGATGGYRFGATLTVEPYRIVDQTACAIPGLTLPVRCSVSKFEGTFSVRTLNSTNERGSDRSMPDFPCFVHVKSTFTIILATTLRNRDVHIKHKSFG